MAARCSFGTPDPNDHALAEVVRERALPLESARDLDPLLDAIGDSGYVLLGEASHGTSEFYTWRTAITRRLVEEKDFSFVAVEGDWPDCRSVDRYVKADPDAASTAEGTLAAFERWPTWMWANRETLELARWLREHNDASSSDGKVGFYGLDVYSLWDSIEEVRRYLEQVDPAAAHAARDAYSCFDPYYDDAEAYARSTALVPSSCEDEAVAILTRLRSSAPSYREGSAEAFFDAEQNALIARNAERYYRTMVRGGPASWNVRDEHMVETLERLIAHHGPAARAIVWEHNTHIGDARFTDMAAAGMINVGQLVRERHADEGVILVGFGRHRGTVLAAEEWGAPVQRMQVPPARAGSTEAVFHEVMEGRDFLLRFDREHAPDDDDPLTQSRGHRAIGVVYHPTAERWGNYVPTLLARRYDAFLYLDRSEGVTKI